MRAGIDAFFPSDANTYAALVIAPANNTRPSSVLRRALAMLSEICMYLARDRCTRC